jgi:hypothetical protein
MANSGLINLHSQAMTYARLSESPGLKVGSSLSGNHQEQFNESNGMLHGRVDRLLDRRVIATR